MIGQLLLVSVLLFACTPLLGPRLPYVAHFVQLPEAAVGKWLQGRRLLLEPFVSGSVHTPVTLDALPRQFHERYPDAKRYRPLWARERDVAEFLYGEVHGAVARRLRAHDSTTLLDPEPRPVELRDHYHASAHLELGEFRPVIFAPRAERLGDISTGSDRFAPYRKAFLVARMPPANSTLRLVTGYLGLHCTHELVGRRNIDRVSTSVDWLVALVDTDGRVVAQAYVGTSSEQWECPVTRQAWEELVNALADELIDALLMPRRHPSH